MLTVVKQLGGSTFFLGPSCADLRWNELAEIISKLNSLVLSHKDIENLNFFERCNILNSIAMLLGCHFQHRVEIFFKEILLIGSGSLGKVKYFAIRVHFQSTGSPHRHRFIWILNLPTANEKSLDDYVDFLFSVVCGNLLSEEED